QHVYGNTPRQNAVADVDRIFFAPDERYLAGLKTGEAMRRGLAQKIAELRREIYYLNAGTRPCSIHPDTACIFPGHCSAVDGCRAGDETLRSPGELPKSWPLDERDAVRIVGLLALKAGGEVTLKKTDIPPDFGTYELTRDEGTDGITYRCRKRSTIEE